MPINPYSENVIFFRLLVKNLQNNVPVKKFIEIKSNKNNIK